MVKIDLHTHSIISPDGAGSITEVDFQRFLEKGVLNCIAITDHNETYFAEKMHKKYGEKIIIGEEITTSEGEMIGLFLNHKISSGMSARVTAKAIHDQGGLVYIPHPFETFRKGIQLPVLEEIVKEIDIFEVFNGRGRWRGKAKEADLFAKKHNLIGAASSDAHGARGVGRTFSIIEEMPTRTTLKKLLAEGTLQKTYASLWTYLYPTMNIIKKKIT
jgi:predicted metal-dependent phosphoesterase TrpH